MNDVIYFLKFSGVVTALVVGGMFVFSVATDNVDNFFVGMGFQLGGAISQDVAKEIHDAVNSHRAQQGLKGLAFDSRLSAIAQQHSENMASQNNMAHVINGQDYIDRIQKSGYNCKLPVTQKYYSRGGENILSYSDSMSAKQIVQWWLDSPTHRETIEAKYWRNSGVGIASNDEAVFITQNFC